jgi:TonB family protein
LKSMTSINCLKKYSPTSVAGTGLINSVWRLTRLGTGRRSFAITGLNHFSIAWILCALCLSSPALAQTIVKTAPIPPHLLTDLKSAAPEKRRAAAEELGGMRNRDAVLPLIAALADKNAMVREAAAFALGQTTDGRAVAPLTKALADKDVTVRASIVFALGMIGERKSGKTLSKLCDDASAMVRAAAATALGVMQDDEGVDELIEMLTDPSFDVRYDATWALGQFNETDAIEHLRAAMTAIDSLPVTNSLREEFRLQAQTSIERIQAQDAGYLPTRPRTVTEGVIAIDLYNNRSNPAVIRQMIHAIPTERARVARISGAVKIKVLVGADGRPARAYVIRRLGYGLDQRAIEAVLQYKFEPAMLSGLPQTAWVFLDVKF